MKFLTLALLASLTNAATRVAVLEVGARGAVRRTTSSSGETTVEGVASFWDALHRNRRLQHAGMSVVPDLFKNADSGFVIGLSGRIDTDNMPMLSGYFTEGEETVGTMEMEGFHCGDLMKKVNAEKFEDASEFKGCGKKHESGFEGAEITVDSTNAMQVDEAVGAVIGDLSRMAEETGKTIVIHLVVEEDDALRRRLLSDHRRLQEEEEGEGEDREGEDHEGEDEKDEGEQQNKDAEDDNANGNQYSGYYGYGYINSYGEWVTPYKTMFQIQYFNVVLWTALGLVIALFFVIYLMIHMPLEPDTLLFGETAKMVGAE